MTESRVYIILFLCNFSCQNFICECKTVLNACFFFLCQQIHVLKKGSIDLLL